MSHLYESQYVCPNCFTQRNINNVFFRRNQMVNRYDERMLNIQSRIAGEKKSNEEDADTEKKSYSLLRWQEVEVACRNVQDGVVFAVQDFNGDLLQTRVCSDCHYPLPPIGAAQVTLLPWANNGVDFTQAARLLNTLASEPLNLPADVTQEDDLNVALAYCVVQTPAGILRYPIGLQTAGDALDRTLLDNYITRANVAALWLEAEPAQEEEQCLDLEAMDSLDRYQQARSSGVMESLRPTVCFVRLAEENVDLMTELRRSHKRLLRAINFCFPSCLILPWRDGDAEIAWKAAGWMMESQMSAPAPAEEPAAAQNTSLPET